MNSGGAMRGGLREPGKLTIDDIEAIDDQLEQVIDWNPTVTVGSREVQYQDRSRSLMIVGHSERGIAADLNTGERVEFSRGSAIAAVRASVSILVAVS